MNAKLLDTLARTGLRSSLHGKQVEGILFLPWQSQQQPRKNLMSAATFWKGMGKRIKQLDEELKAVAHKLSDKGKGKLGIGGTTWPFSPEVYRGLFAVPEIVEGKDKKKYYKLEIPLGKEFKGDNVTTALKNYNLHVTALVKDESRDEKKHFLSVMEIERQITLPDYIDLEKVESLMGDDGVFRIKAPVLPGIEPPPHLKETPIKHIK